MEDSAVPFGILSLKIEVQIEPTHLPTIITKTLSCHAMLGPGEPGF